MSCVFAGPVPAARSPSAWRISLLRCFVRTKPNKSRTTPNESERKPNEATLSLHAPDPAECRPRRIARGDRLAAGAAKGLARIASAAGRIKAGDEAGAL